MNAGLSFQTVAGCVGGLIFLAFARNYQCTLAWAQTAKSSVAFQNAATPHPPAYSAPADVAPSVRREVVVPMPTRLSVERKPDRLSVGFDLAAPRKVKIVVHKNMSIGVKYEMRVYAKGAARPQNPGGVGYASIKEPVTPSEPVFLNGKAFLNSADGGIPAPGKRYVIEEDVSIFETDIPAQHMWRPESGSYRVIWVEKLRTVR
jgi:hypothetical protein